MSSKVTIGEARPAKQPVGSDSPARNSDEPCPSPRAAPSPYSIEKQEPRRQREPSTPGSKRPQTATIPEDQGSSPTPHRSARMSGRAAKKQPYASAGSEEEENRPKEKKTKQTCLIVGPLEPKNKSIASFSTTILISIADNDPKAKNSSAPSSPQPGPHLSEASKTTGQSEDPSSGQGRVPSLRFNAKSNVTEGTWPLTRPADPPPGRQKVTPSKSTKSDIAPWMTLKHKRAIRRSLEAASANSSSNTTAVARKGSGNGSTAS